jgi:hypothetical protein
MGIGLLVQSRAPTRSPRSVEMHAQADSGPCAGGPGGGGKAVKIFISQSHAPFSMGIDAVWLQ